MNDSLHNELSALADEVKAVDLRDRSYHRARQNAIHRTAIAAVAGLALLSAGIAGATAMWPTTSANHSVPADGGDCETPSQSHEDEPEEHPSGSYGPPPPVDSSTPEDDVAKSHESPSPTSGCDRWEEESPTSSGPGGGGSSRSDIVIGSEDASPDSSNESDAPADPDGGHSSDMPPSDIPGTSG